MAGPALIPPAPPSGALTVAGRPRLPGWSDHEHPPPGAGAGTVGFGSAGPRVGSACTGYGGLELAVLRVLGGRVLWCADPDPHIAAVLAARFPGVTNLGDITTVDWAAVAAVDVLCAGFPCQDLSVAGKGAGITEGTRSGLWLDIAAAVRCLRPRLVWLENVAALRWRRPGLGRVLGDLAHAGYDACWRSVRAADLAAAHRRERVFLLAAPSDRPPHSPTRAVADPDRHR